MAGNSDWGSQRSLHRSPFTFKESEHEGEQ